MRLLSRELCDGFSVSLARVNGPAHERFTDIGNKDNVGRPEALVQKGSWITTYDVGLRIAGMIPI
jgi:hypothetical protein